MDETTGTSILTRVDALQAILEALRADIVERGWTLSLYTSKKRRRWVSIKTFEPVAFSTSVEVDVTDTETALLTSLCLAMRLHIAKHETGELIADKWVAAPLPIALVVETWTWLESRVEASTPDIAAGSRQRHTARKDIK